MALTNGYDHLSAHFGENYMACCRLKSRLMPSFGEGSFWFDSFPLRFFVDHLTE